MCSMGLFLPGLDHSPRHHDAQDPSPGAPSAHPRIRAGVGALPDALLVDMLERVSLHTGTFDAALVCRAWRQLSATCTLSMGVRPGAKLATDSLLQQAAHLRQVTSLHLPLASLLTLEDSLLRHLPRAVPLLRHVSIEKGAASQDCSLSPHGLAALASALPGLESLSLPELGYALALPPAVCRLPRLTSLRSLRLKQLPENLGALTSLKSLHLSSNSLVQLPASACHLSSLASLTLELLELEGLPEAVVGGWVSLRDCRISSRVLSLLPSSLTTLTRLRSLHIECRELQQLPEGLSRLPHLTHMELLARSLRAFPPDFALITALKVLEAGRAFRALGASHQQQQQHLHHARAASGSPHGRAQESPEMLPPLIRTLSISSFWGVDLPDSLCELPHLHTLAVEVCPSLRTLPHSLGSLTALRDLAVDLCALESLPPSVCALKGLRRMSLTNCAGLRRLPDELGGLSGLTELRIEGCSALEGFPHTFSRLWSLRILALIGCHSLRSLPLDIGHVRTMRHLDVVRCGALVMVPHSLGDLQCLQRLVLENNSALTTLPESVSRLIALKELRIWGCPNLARVPLGPAQLGLLSSASRSHVLGLGAKTGAALRRKSKKGRWSLSSLLAA